MADTQIQKLIDKIDALINSMKSGGAKTQSEKVDTASYSLMEKLRSATRDKYELDEKSYEALKKQHQALEDNVKLLEEEGEIEEEILNKQKARLDKAKKELDTLKNQAKVNEKRIDSEKSLLSLQGKLTNGIKSRLGLEINSDKVQKSISDSLKKGESNAKALSAGMGSFLKQSTSAVNTTRLLIEGFNFLHTQFKQIDNDSRDLARSLNLTYNEAAKVRDQLMEAALNTKAFDKELTSTYATGKAFSKSMVEMNAQLGTSARLENERLSTYTQLRDVAKFEAVVLEDINRMSLASNQTQLDITKNRLAQINLSKIQLGRQVDERKVMQDIAKASYNIKINYLGRDKDLAKAATQARALGMELSQTERIAESLMNFESSIQNQMEAELLTGRTLNLERARYFALTNDLVGLQTELNKQGITAEKFGKMNRIQQSAIAGAMGMSKDEMSKMLVEQKALQNLGVGSLEAAQEKYELAVKNGTVDKFTKELGDKSLLRQFQQQSLQERMTMAVEKMLSAFEKLAVVFRPFYKGLLLIVEALGTAENLLKSMVILAGVLAARKIGGLFAGAGAAGLGAAATGAAATTAAGAAAGGATVAAAAAKGGKAASAVSRMKQAGQAASVAGATTGAAATGAAAGSTSIFSKIASGAKGLAGKLNPVTALRTAAKGAGGWTGLLGKALKGSILNTVISALLGFQEFKSLMENPVDEKGDLLSKKALSQKAGKIVFSTGGSILGGIIGAALGGPIASMVGSFGGQFLMSKLAEAWPGGSEWIGEKVVPQEKLDAAPSLYQGGVVEKTGLINAHAGEVYTGGGTLKMFEGMWQEMKNQNQQLKEQNKYLAAIANKSTVLQLDRQVLATEMGKEVAMSYGNILNPGSQTFS